MTKKIVKLIGLIIIIFILGNIDLVKIKEVFLNSNKYYLIFGLSLTILVAFVKSLRWNYIKKIQGIKYSIIDSFIMYCVGISAGIITPGNLGELSKTFYLKSDGRSYGKSIFSVIIDRMFDVVFLLIFGTIGVLFFFAFFEREIPYIASFAVAVLTLTYLFLKTDLLKIIFSKIFNFIIPVKYQKSWQLNLRDFVVDLKNLKTKHYLFALIITLLSWLLYYFQMFIFAKAIEINISFLYLAISVTASGIITMVPISYSGIGTRDLTLISLFSLVFISKESAVAFSSLVLLTYVIMAVFGFFCWLKKPF